MSVTDAAPRTPAYFRAIEHAHGIYSDAKRSLTSEAEVPWDLHANRAVKELNTAVSLLQPHAVGENFTAGTVRTSIGYAKEAVGLIERAKAFGPAVATWDMVDAISSAQFALFEQ